MLGFIKKISGNQKPSRLPNVPYHILSFNNVVNVYHDKRVSFSDEQYKARAMLTENLHQYGDQTTECHATSKEIIIKRNAHISLGETYGIDISNPHSEQEEIRQSPNTGRTL